MSQPNHHVVDVSIFESTGVERIDHAVFGAVPFAQGQFIQKALWMTLAGEGKTFPVHAKAAGFWPDGSVKWLQLCGRVDLKAGIENKFGLFQNQADHKASVKPNPITCEITSNRAVVTTDKLTLTLDLAAQTLMQVELKSADGGLKPMLKGPGISSQVSIGRPANSNAAPPATDTDPVINWQVQPGSLSIVEQTENRVICRLNALYLLDAQPMLEMVLFIEILQGSSDVRLQPVFIYLGDQDLHTISGLILSVHSTLGHTDGRFALAQQHGSGHWDVPQPVGPESPRAKIQDAKPLTPENYLPNRGGVRFPIARILQTGSSFYVLQKQTKPENNWVNIARGQRNPGWVHLEHPTDGNLTAAMRYFWQEYPRSITLNADHGDITFGLVPPGPDSAPLNFKRYSEYRWGAANYETGRGPFPSKLHGAAGLSKSSELLLHFETATTDNQQPAKTSLHWANPTLIMPDKHQVEASAVFGQIAAAPAKGFEELEAQLAGLVDFIINERDYRNWYGLLDFGDVMISYYNAKDQWAYDDGGYAWLNTEALPDHGLWLSALRSQRHDWLRASVEMTRHNRDVDIFHRGNFKGTGSRHNIQHWGDADKEWRISMPITQRLHYFLTGDPWSREVIFDTIAVYQSYKRTSRLAPSMASAMIALQVKHELTGDPNDGVAIRNMLDLFATTVGEDGHFANDLHVDLATGLGHIVPDGLNLMGKYFFLFSFGGQHGLVMGQEAYKHEQLQAAFKRYCEMALVYVPDREAYMCPQVKSSIPFLASVYRHTGDEKFADAIRKSLLISSELELKEVGADGPLDTPRHFALVNCERINKVTCSLGQTLNSLPYGFKALQKKSSH